MRTFTIVISALLLASLAAPLRAQEPQAPAPEQTLSLPQALDLAREHSPLLKASGQEVAMALAKVDQARAQLLPRIDVGMTFRRSDSPLITFGDRLNQERVTAADFDPRRLNNPSALSNFNSYMEITQPVYNGGKEWIGLEQSRLSQQATTKADRRTVEQLRFQVTRAYYGVILAREQLQVAREALKTAAAHVTQARSLFRSGMVVESDVLSAEVRLAQVREFLVSSENELALSRAALNTVMGVEESRPFRLTGELKFSPFTQDPQTLKERARRFRPDLEALRLQVRVAQQGVRLSSADYLPRLNLAGRYDFNDEHFMGSGGESWTVMAMLTWNLFDGLGTRARVNEAEAGLQRTRALEERLAQEIDLQVRQAYLDILTARGRYEAGEKAVDQARESLRIIENRYRAGLATVVELLDGDVRVTQARLSTLNALYEYAVARARLDLAVGEGS